MTECRTIIADPGVPYAIVLDTAAPVAQMRAQLDHTARVDCDNQGITIALSQWSIVYDPDNDLVLSQEAITGLWTSVLVSGNQDGKTYELRNVITTSDGRVLPINLEWRCQETKSTLRAA